MVEYHNHICIKFQFLGWSNIQFLLTCEDLPFAYPPPPSDHDDSSYARRYSVKFYSLRLGEFTLARAVITYTLRTGEHRPQEIAERRTMMNKNKPRKK